MWTTHEMLKQGPWGSPFHELTLAEIIDQVRESLPARVPDRVRTFPIVERELADAYGLAHADRIDISVPKDWSPAMKRAIIAHELAHVASEHVAAMKHVRAHAPRAAWPVIDQLMELAADQLAADWGFGRDLAELKLGRAQPGTAYFQRAVDAAWDELGELLPAALLAALDAPTRR